MRRKDREITGRDEIIAVMKKCDICRLALNDDGYPYIIPLNFGLDVSEDHLRLVFHSALEGKKLDLMRQDSRASFEMDTGHTLQYFPEKGYCTMAYESVCGRGRILFPDEAEKAALLQKLMNQYHPEGTYYNPAALSRTAVYVLEVESVTGKRKQTQ